MRGLVLAVLAALSTAMVWTQGLSAQNAAKPGYLNDGVCASTFVLNAQLRPESAQASMERARFVAGKIRADNPKANPQEIQASILGDAQAMGRRIEAKLLVEDSFNNDLRACDRRFGFGKDAQKDRALADSLFGAAEALGAKTPRSLAEDGQMHDFYYRACLQDHARACFGYGFSQTGDAFMGNVTAKREVLFGYERACDLGDGEGCLEHAREQSPMKVTAVTKDWAGADASYRKACDGHGLAAACGELTGLLASDRNPTPDIGAAADFRRKACQGGLTTAC
ncbi:MAG: hypothetical protein NXH71_10505 [Erythrobacteraceae bacterium]|jgi:hypothetical protein|nr:hypothetical protein [Erythrobacteraceae bacterium]